MKTIRTTTIVKGAITNMSNTDWKQTLNSTRLEPDGTTSVWIDGEGWCSTEYFIETLLEAQRVEKEKLFSDEELEYIYNYLETNADGEPIRPIFYSIEKKIRSVLEPYKSHDEKNTVLTPVTEEKDKNLPEEGM